MILRPFVYSSLRHWRAAECIARFTDDLTPEPAPDCIHGPAQVRPKAGWDRFGAVHDGHGNLIATGRYLYRLHNVVVVRGGPLGPWGLHIALDDHVCALEACPRGNRDIVGIEGVSFDLDGSSVAVNMLPNWDDATIPRETAPAICYLSEWDNNYYHRVFDTLPRAWAEKMQLTPPDARWLRSDAPAVRCDTLYFPSWWPPKGYAPGPIEWLRDCRPEPGTSNFDILYLTRAGTRKRRVANESDTVRTLERFGKVTVMSCGDLDFSEQQQIFRHAKMIVGPHGAALTNVVWSDHCAVIELLPASFPHICYQYVAKWSGHWYGRMMCDEVSRQSDMFVEVEALAAMVDEARRAIG
ncbi:MAG TPA: glycosyltransferase family 61 protein [Stellaceae bacterium]|nr:glycosyltransferase family 61 protein [Stellaceae bacterium]